MYETDVEITSGHYAGNHQNLEALNIQPIVLNPDLFLGKQCMDYSIPRYGQINHGLMLSPWNLEGPR